MVCKPVLNPLSHTNQGRGYFNSVICGCRPRALTRLGKRDGRQVTGTCFWKKKNAAADFVHSFPRTSALHSLETPGPLESSRSTDRTAGRSTADALLRIPRVGGQTLHCQNVNSEPGQAAGGRQCPIPLGPAQSRGRRAGGCRQSQSLREERGLRFANHSLQDIHESFLQSSPRREGVAGMWASVNMEPSMG